MRTTSTAKWLIFILSLFLIPGIKANTKDSTNEQQARQIFNKTYQMVFGPQGSTLHYDVNIIGIYKTNGNIAYKGKKMRYVEDRYDSWNDGVTAYMVDKKKRKVSIYKASSDKKDKYLSKFKYNLNDFDYSWKPSNGDYLVKMKLRNSNFIGIREVEGLIDSKTYTPISLRIKVAFFWTTVKISKFQSGNISDETFVFPRNNFKDFQFEDKRNSD